MRCRRDQAFGWSRVARLRTLEFFLIEYNILDIPNGLHSRRCWSGPSEAIIFIRFHILSRENHSDKILPHFYSKRYAIRKKKNWIFFVCAFVNPLPPKIYIEEMKNVLTYRNNHLRKFDLDFDFFFLSVVWSSLL